MDDQITQILSESEDPRELLEAALRLAEDSNEQGHEFLFSRLDAPPLLSRLDSEEDYQAHPRTLRVTRILDALAKNKAAVAASTFTRLCGSNLFTSRLERIEALILTSEPIRPPSQGLLDFWDQNSAAEDSSLNLVIRAVLTNGARESILLFESRMLDPAISSSVKQGWLLSSVVPNRNGIELLQAMGRLVESNLEDALKAKLIEVTFDFQAYWYSPSNVTTAPPRSADVEVHRHRKALARLALQTLTLEPALTETLKAEIRGE